MARTYKISPDGNSIAVSSDYPSPEMAYGVMNVPNGGYWASADQLKDWSEVTEITAPPEPEPPAEPEGPTP